MSSIAALSLKKLSVFQVLAGPATASCRKGPEMARKIALWALAIIASLAVFALYSRPDFLFALANQIWACF